MSSRGREIQRWGGAALQQLRGPVLTEFRKKLAVWKDPRARLLRRRRRAGRATAGGAVTTGVLGGGSFLVYSPETVGVVPDPGVVQATLELAGFGLGGTALAVGIGTVGAAVKYRRLKRTPLPDAPVEPVELPPADSCTHQPMRRLRDAEQSMRAVLSQLRASCSVPEEPVAGSRAAADEAAAASRQVAERIRAVESTLPHVAGSDRAVLRSHVERMSADLDAGVEGYCDLVAAAGKAVAASAPAERSSLLQDATDQLAGVAVALRELFPGAEDASPRTAGERTGDSRGADPSGER